METAIFIGIVILWCIFLFVTSKDFGLIIDDTTLYAKPVSNVWYSRLYGSHTVDSIFWDRAISIGLHCLVSCLVVAFISPMAGVLFSVHPTTLQVSVWLNGKRFAVNGIISMLMYKFPVAIVLYPAVFLFQPSAIPAIILSKASIYLLFLIIPVAFLFRNQIKGFYGHIQFRLNDNKGTDLHRFHARKLIFAVKSLWFYFRQSVLPEKNVMYYSDHYGVGMDREATDKMYQIDFPLVAGLFAIAFISCNFENGWWFWLLFIMQWLNILTITQTFADRYAYIALIGSCWYLSTTPVALLFVGYYVCRSIENVQQYTGIIEFFKYNMAHDKKNPNAGTFLVSTLLNDGRFNADAFVYAKETLESNPTSCVANLTMGRVLLRLGKKEQGIDYLTKALSLAPEARKEISDSIRTEIASARQQ